MWRPLLYPTCLFFQVYERLGVKLVDRGESFYQSRMEGVVKMLQDAGMLEEDDGRKVGVMHICIFNFCFYLFLLLFFTAKNTTQGQKQIIKEPTLLLRCKELSWESVQ